MVARTLFDQRYSSISKWVKATVINDIWPEIVFFSLVATMVTLVSEKTSTSLAVSSQMLTVLGIVLGLVVSFRTSSAYDRYWEGRKLWTSINLASRNIAHMIWIHIPNERPGVQPAPSSIGESPTDSKATLSSQEIHLKAIIEKKSMINLVQAFSVAVKHMLRGEPGIYYRDLYPLVCYLPRYASDVSGTHDHDAHKFELPLFAASAGMTRARSVPDERRVNGDAVTEKGKDDMFLSWRKNKKIKRADTFDPEAVLPQISPEDGELMNARNPPNATAYDYFPFLLIFKPFIAIARYPINKFRGGTKRTPVAPAPPMHHSTSGASTHTNSANPSANTAKARDKFGRRKRPAIIESNVPLEITLFLSTYLAWLQKNGLVSPPIASGLTTNIGSLQDTMANLDRIRSTPIPFAYQAHLRMTMWLYLFFLPFQVYSAFGYLTIPATAFASYLLLGFLEIGQEIEDPFGYDMNDLDLDYFCLNIERELHEITAHPAPDPDTFIFGPTSQPFAPADRRSAEEMLAAGCEKADESNYNYLHEEKGAASLNKMMLKSWKEVVDRTVERKYVL